LSVGLPITVVGRLQAEQPRRQCKQAQAQQPADPAKHGPEHLAHCHVGTRVSVLNPSSWFIAILETTKASQAHFIGSKHPPLGADHPTIWCKHCYTRIAGFTNFAAGSAFEVCGANPDRNVTELG
jgi:hypothetical protein